MAAPVVTITRPDIVNSGTGGGTITGHIVTSGPTPTITGGGGAGASITGNDNAGRITIGTGIDVEMVEITFSSSWQNPPVCTSSNESAQVTCFTAATQTKLTITSSSAFMPGDVVAYSAIGYV